MSSISYNKISKVFSLHTSNSTYQMQVGDYGILYHLYYGAPVEGTEMVDQIIYAERGTSGNPFEAGDRRPFSLDLLPQEYSTCGNGDYRLGAIEVEHADGSNVLDLRYDSYKITKGKYRLAGMPAMFGTEEEADTLEITLKDTATDVYVTLLYGVFPKLDVITRAVRIRNEKETSIKLQKAMSMMVDFHESEMDFIHFYGQHNMERTKERTTLRHGIQSIGSVRGASSHQNNPFAILCDHTATEDFGNCFGFSFVYSGNFTFEVEVDQIQQARAMMGIHPYHFTFELQKGEVFETPEVIMAYSGAGLTRLSHVYHDALRSNLIRSKYVEKPRPILVNNWEATYMDFTSDKIYNIAKVAKEIGLDMLVLDDGWFGKRDTDKSGLGDWYVNEVKMEGSLKKLTDRIHGLGLKFGLWVEPEMVSEDSDLFREHPEWVMRIPGRDYGRSRYQLNLDITQKEARDYVMNCIFKVLDSIDVDYVKWDMNRSLGNVFSQALPSEKQGEVYHRYVLAVYDMQEQLVSRYPNLLLENCTGGGGRFDAGMLYYSPQIWTSDDTDAVARLCIQHGTSFGYPISTMGSHVSVCPNHQTGRITPFETRAIVASAGTFGYELDLENLSDEEKAMAKEQILKYKEMEHLVQSGDYYRLTDPSENHFYTLWQFVSKDKTETIVHGMIESMKHAYPRFKMKGLDPTKLYEDLRTGKVYSGAALMNGGLPIGVEMRDYTPIEFKFKEKINENVRTEK